MKKWFRWVLAGLAVVALIGAVALAEGPGGPAPGTGPGPARPQAAAGRQAAMIVQKLGITQEQAAKIREILTGSTEEQDRLQKAVKVARLRLSLALEEGASSDKLAALIKDCEAAAKPLKDFREALLRKAFAVLTVEQQARVIVTVGDEWWRLLALRQRPPGR